MIDSFYWHIPLTPPIFIFHVIKITYVEQNYHREQHYVRFKCVSDKCVHSLLVEE